MDEKEIALELIKLIVNKDDTYFEDTSIEKRVKQVSNAYEELLKLVKNS